MVEAAGIEPASEKQSQVTPTCLAFVFLIPQNAQGRLLKGFPSIFLIYLATWDQTDQPNFLHQWIRLGEQGHQRLLETLIRRQQLLAQHLRWHLLFFWPFYAVTNTRGMRLPVHPLRRKPERPQLYIIIPFNALD